MKRILLLLFGLLTCVFSHGQNIIKLEYFFDVDPGFGNGSSVSVTPASSITDFIFNIDIASQSDGFHTLSIRCQDGNGNWSFTNLRPVYKISASSFAPTPNVNKLEYFIDSDPGFGAGTDVPVTAATSITDYIFPVPIGSVTDGFHTLTIRSQDGNGNWGTANSRPFYKLSASAFVPAPNLNKLEYFIDTDPGLGLGVDVPITPGTSITDQIISIPVTSLSEAFHVLTFRARDANNNWSVVVVKTISVCNHPPTTANAAASITSSGFNVSWQDVPGSIGYQLDVSTDNFSTFVTGYNAKAISAPTLSASVSGLAQATAYQYRVRSVASCTSVNTNSVNATTLATPPTAQPTNLLFSSITSNALTAFYTAAAPAPTGYLVVRKAGSSTTFVPSNNTSYSNGQAVGDGIVAYVGLTFLFNETTLSPNTQYFYTVFSYNQFNGSISYLTTSPLQNNARTIALEPTVQPTSLQFISVTDNSFSVSFTASSGNPDGYVVLRKTSSTPTSVPADGSTYTTTIGTDVIAYQGSATTFAESGLTQNTLYYYSIYAYNGSGSAINYLAVAPLQGSQLTTITVPAASPTNLVFSSVTPSSITVSYTVAAGSPSGYMVVRKTGSSPAFVPQINTAYTQGQTLSDGMVVYVGPALSFSDNGLSASTDYFYDVFAYNQSGSLYSYKTNSPLEGDKTTFTAEPTAQPTGFIFPSIAATSITVSFTAASPAPSGYLVLRKAGSAPTSVPADGTSYSAPQTLGDGIIPFTGTATGFVDSGLLPGTVYFYQVFSYNGSGVVTNYLTTVASSNSDSKITLPDKPVLGSATLIQQNQFMVNWTAVTGAANYRLDVSKNNFVTMVSGFDNLLVSGTSVNVTGLEIGAAYKYRLRAANSSGISDYSDERQQFTIPAAPALSAAMGIGQTTFTANWTAVPGATGYYIDVSLVNTFTNYLAGYQNKSLTSVTSEIINGLTPGTTYFYRIRSSNDGGISPDSNPIGNQPVIPATPVGLDAANTTTTSFKAKWQAVSGANSYRLDVTLDSDNFSPSLTNFTDKAITGITEDLVTGLTPNTAYRYRIRAVNDGGTSPSSTPITVPTMQTGSISALQLSTPIFTSAFTGATTSATVEVSGGTSPYSMSFCYRKITANDFIIRPITSSGTSYQTTVDASMLDDLGVEFYFKVIDVNLTQKETAHGYIFNAIATDQKSIPTLSSGGQLKDYTIFSVPYALTDNNISNIFEELGKYEKFKWRLVRYQGGKNVDYTEGLTKIELGKGYWFNAVDKAEITIGDGTVYQANQTAPFKLKLDKEWNQIGDPFTFNVDWSDVLAANPSLASKVDQAILVFDGSTSGFKETDVLRAWGGGFVFANEAVELILPVTLKNTYSGGRKGNQEIIAGSLDEQAWFLPMTLRHGSAEHTYGGLGMRPDASESKDVFDKHTLPRFVNYLEWNTYHKDFFNPWFARDIVPTSDAHTWIFTAESNFKAGEAQLTWDHLSLGNNTAQLFLLDEENQTVVDMKKTGSYSFELDATRTFRIYFSKDEQSLHPDVSLLGLAYPNPFSESTTIPFVTNEKRDVQITVYDMTGRKVKDIVNGVYEPGVHAVRWDRTDYAGATVPNGMYIYLMNGVGKGTRSFNKIIAR